MRKNRFDKATNSKVNRFILIVLLTMIVAFLMVLKAQSQEVRYLVSIDDGDYRNVKVLTFKSIDKMAAYYFDYTGHVLNTDKIFTGSNVYFQYRESCKIFYCEKKKIITRRNGKRVLRAIRKKEVHIYNKVKYSLN